MIILGIDTACDDTCAAVVADGEKILSNIISSQSSIHQKFGGVVPEIASRKQLELIYYVIEDALDTAGISLRDLEAIGVTNEHGLAGSLFVGIAAAKAIAYCYKLPLIGVNHIQGHIYTGFLTNSDIEVPHVCLTVSGGHTMIIYVKGPCKHEVLGYTLDDTAGEAYDKIARFLGIGFPGGPVIDRLSKRGNPEAFAFPRPLLNRRGFLFSFSGLKTAVIREIKKIQEEKRALNTNDLVSSFQQAVVDVLVMKTIRAAREKKVSTISLTGGVAANSRLRRDLLTRGKKENLKMIYPSLELCTDNAAMIAGLAYHIYELRHESGLDLKVRPSVLI